MNTITLIYLADAGLDAVNISLDTLHAKKFEFVSRRPAAGHKKVFKKRCEMYLKYSVSQLSNIEIPNLILMNNAILTL